MNISRRALLAGAAFGVTALATRRIYAGPDEIEMVMNGLCMPVQVAGLPVQKMHLVDRMAHFHVPGISICRIKDGQIAWVKGVGVRGPDGKPIEENTLFQAASISKSITAATAMRLVELGVLSLDGDIEDHLGGWKIPREDGVGNAPVSLKMLLSHTGGISATGLMGYAPGAPLPTLDDMLEGRAPANSEPARVVKEPGTESIYSNNAYIIVQRAIETATARDFASVAKELILDPVGMSLSNFAQPLPEHLKANAATAHDGEGNPLPGGFMVQPELAAAGLWSTTSDLARYLIAYKRAFRGEPGAILSQASAVIMAERSMSIWATGFELIGKEGWGIYHTGSNIGFKSMMLIERDSDNGFVIMTNGDNGSNLYQETQAGIALIYGWPHLRPAERATLSMTADDLAAFAGTFHMDEPIVADFVVTASDNHLIVEVPGFLPASEFFPQAENSFFDRSGSEIAFERDAAGKASTLIWDGSIRAGRTH